MSRPLAHRHLPVPLTQLRGRHAELGRLVDLLIAQETRLLTITGTGGCGKTRLAIEVAGRAGAHFDDGAAFVGLAAVNDAALVAVEIARSLGVAMPPGVDELDALCERLRHQQLLVVIDNFEHLTARTDVIGQLVSRCPELALLVTSRRRLHLPGEVVVPLAPLNVTTGPAQELFWERAHAVQPDLDVTPERQRAVAEICARLDGLPLAIELAAARSRLLSPEAILDRLTTSTWQVLRAPAIDAPARGGSLDRTIAWSHDLLDHPARVLLRRLSVFEGAFTLEVAEAVVASPELPAADVFDALSTLVDLHLVEPEPSTNRYALLHTIRLFADDRLAEAGERRPLRDRHAEVFLAAGSDLAALIERGGERPAYEHLEAELPELRAAMTHLGQTDRHLDALRIAIALGPYWLFRARLSEGRRWLTTDRHPDASPDGLLIAQARGWSARLAVDASAGAATQPAEAVTDLEEAWSLLQPDADRRAWLWAGEHLSYALRLYEGPERAGQVTDAALAEAAGAGLSWWVAELLHRRALIATQSGDNQRAVVLAREAIDAARASGHERIHARARQVLAMNGGYGGDLAAVDRVLEEVRAQSAACGDLRGLAVTIPALGAVAARAGDLPLAASWWHRAIDFGEETGYWHGSALGILGLVAMAGTGPEPTAIAWLHGALSPYLPVLEREIGPKTHRGYGESLSAVETAIGRQAYTAAVAAGRTQPWAAVVDEARRVLQHWLAASPAPGRPMPAGRAAPTLGGPLSEREIEVLELMAVGHTNHEIARELHMSPKTAMHHTGHIYRKLGVRGRAQAVAYATEHGLTTSGVS